MSLFEVFIFFTGLFVLGVIGVNAVVITIALVEYWRR